MVAHARHSKTFLFLAFFGKKTFHKQKNFTFILKTLSFRKCFLNKNIFVSKKLFSFWKHFHFCFGNTS